MHFSECFSDNFLFEKRFKFIDADHFPYLVIYSPIPLNIIVLFQLSLAPKEKFKEGIFEMSLLLIDTLLSDGHSQGIHIDLITYSC